MDIILAEAPQSLIDGVCILPRKQIVDDRGAVLHMLRADAAVFEAFGEVYFSEIRPGAVKAWKRHRSMTQHFAVPVGRVRLVMVDGRSGSATRGVCQELVLGRPDAYHLVRLPPGVWYGFKGLGQSLSLLANCADMPHDPEESETAPVEAGPLAVAWEDV